MKLDDYQKRAEETAVYPKRFELEYLLAGLTSEVGELAGAYKKHLRGDYGRVTFLTRASEELGDILWYLSMLAKVTGFELSTIAEMNLDELAYREKTNTIKGDTNDETGIRKSNQGTNEKGGGEPPKEGKRIQQGKPTVKLPESLSDSKGDS